MSHFETLVRASRLYYELGETQERIASLLGVTRPQVSRLLKQARAEGVVEIRIVDRTTDDSPAGQELQRRFELRSVHLAPSLAGPEDLTRRSIARLGAQVLRSAVRDGAIVGIGDGASVSATADAVSDALGESTSPVSVTVVPLCGGYWFAGPGREPFRRIADAFGGTPHGLLAPGLVDDATTKQALYGHAGIQTILGLWNRLDVALFGIGGRAWSEATVGAETARELDRADAVGEVLIAPFAADGRFVCDALRERVIAYDARRLRQVAVTIGVAGGPTKVTPILGALRAGIVNTLVTDVATAEAVVRVADAAEWTAEAPEHIAEARAPEA